MINMTAYIVKIEIPVSGRIRSLLSTAHNFLIVFLVCTRHMSPVNETVVECEVLESMQHVPQLEV